ncbi:unnamed protein product [Lactuca virosa]|uniref:Uncharacterized protein n=1 Tax=Lactuca virosa TaxID=75947 RepID=A0AAU9MAX6_9ASTR|nr:unnamed protein product [Lactuca virosa]
MGEFLSVLCEESDGEPLGGEGEHAVVESNSYGEVDDEKDTEESSEEDSDEDQIKYSIHDPKVKWNVMKPVLGESLSVVHYLLRKSEPAGTLSVSSADFVGAPDLAGTLATSCAKFTGALEFHFFPSPSSALESKEHQLHRRHRSFFDVFAYIIPNISSVGKPQKMGNSISLVCCPYELVRERGDVLVIKEDGESLRFKDGIFVKDILFAYPYHKIIRCCSERTVVPRENQLSCNWLYFLLPVGLALSEAAYRSLIRSAASQNLNASITTMIKIEENNQQRKENDHKGKGPAYKDCSSTYKWKPILRTIPEITSPSI